MAHLAVPGPFDFALTTERFRAFGLDRATAWHEGGLHRIVGGREVRIEAAPGGVDVEPLDEETEPVVRTVLGLVFELGAFYEWAADDEVKARLVALRGLGEWTADWFLARHLARPNAWPCGDLALRKAVSDLYGGLDVREARERFHPYENLSAHYLLLSQRAP